MKKTIVKTNFGLMALSPPAEYPNARAPKNQGYVVRPWPIRRLAIIYHCKTCTALKREKKSNE